MRKWLGHSLGLVYGKMVLSIAILVPQLLQAQHLPPDTSEAIRNLKDVVVTGQIGGEITPAKSTIKVKVLDQRQIQARGAFNLGNLLSNELNIRLNQNPILGNSLSLQGVSGQNIKILVDGVPLIGRENGNIDLNQVNLNNVERIELIEGPMSVNYGTDALGGVINLISKKPATGLRSVSANGYAESIGQFNVGFQVGFSSKKMGLQFGGGRNFFYGFPDSPAQRAKIWKPRVQYFSDASLVWFLKNGSLKWNTNFFDEKTTNKGAAVITPYEGYATDEYYYTRRLGTSVFFDQKWSGKHHLNIVASYQNYRRIRNTVYKDLVSLKEQLVANAGTQDTNYFQLWMSRGTYAFRTANRKLGYQLGYEINYESNTGSRLQNGFADMGDYNIFGSAEWKPAKRFVLRPGLRASYNTRFSAPLIPSLHIKYDLGERMVFRASYARGFRAPSLKEMFLFFVDPNHNVFGNPNLKPEESNNLQAALLFENRNTKRVWRIEPSVFLNQITNLIDLARIEGNAFQVKYLNVSELRTAALNLNSEWKTRMFQLSAAYSLTARSNSFIQQVSGAGYLYSNECRLNAGLTFEKSATAINLFYKYNGRFQTYQVNNTTQKISLSYIDAFSLFDATISKGLLKHRLSLTAGCKNLLDVMNVNASMMSGPHSGSSGNALIGMGRSYFISCRINLEWSKK